MTRSDDLLALWEVRDRFVEGDRWFERALELPGDFCRPRAASLSMLGRHREAVTLLTNFAARCILVRDVA